MKNKTTVLKKRVAIGLLFVLAFINIMTPEAKNEKTLFACLLVHTTIIIILLINEYNRK